MSKIDKINIRNVVRNSYGKIADNKTEKTECCSDNVSTSIGYSHEEISNIPEDSNMGLGCGNPQTFAEIKEGEIVIDLGSGGGFDCFLASQKVGRRGRVIGVDMTPEMISKSRNLARKNRYRNVDFRLGEIENLPVADNTADVVISNCVINLSPNKQRVYDEMHRILKNGGRVAISDVVRIKEMTDDMMEDEDLYCG